MSNTKRNKDIVQFKNPKTGRYSKLDRASNTIIDTKTSDKKPFANVPVMRKRKKNKK